MVPVESGALRDSIGWTWGDAPSGAISLGKAKAGRLSITIYAGGGEAFYAWFQEFGTVNMPANPFFFPSYRKLRRKAKGRVTRKINKAIRSS